ncbi:MAG: hypothetical protein ACLR1V_10020 [Coprococcus sp.]
MGEKLAKKLGIAFMTRI